MKKILISLIALVACFLPGSGQEVAESIQIGYCFGENGSMGDVTSSTAKSMSAAIYVTSGMLESLTGNHIESIRVYIPSKINITSMTAWVRTSPDGENLAEGTVKSKEVVKGWNDIQLETPYELKDDTPLYIGYTFEQKSRAYAICCTGSYMDGGLFYKIDDGEWQTDNKYGNLCLEGIVKGDKLPVHELELNYISVPPTYYVGDKLAVKMRVTNHGTASISGFTLSYSIPEFVDAQQHVECDIPSCRFADISLDLPALNLPEDDEFDISFNISALDEGEDTAPGNNSQSMSLSTAANEFKKVVLVEEFTTEQCGNCPTAAPKVYAAVDKFNDEHPGSVALICHHAGYGTDFLTSRFDEAYLSMYGSVTFAPAIMVDRYCEPGDLPVANVISTTDVYERIAKAYSSPVEYSLNADARFDENTQKLTVDIKGSRTVEQDVTPTRVTVVVVENNIPQKRQSGTEDEEYIHQHVMRQANSAWGEVIDWSGYTFDYSCTLDIDEKWVKDNLQIIVFINQYDADDKSKRNVENARIVDFPDGASVSIMSDDEKVPTPYCFDGRMVVDGPYDITSVWTISGARVANFGLTTGLYIVDIAVDDRICRRKVLVK